MAKVNKSFQIIHVENHSNTIKIAVMLKHGNAIVVGCDTDINVNSTYLNHENTVVEDRLSILELQKEYRYFTFIDNDRQCEIMHPKSQDVFVIGKIINVQHFDYMSTVIRKTKNWFMSVK